MSTSKMAIPQGWQLLPIVETIPSTNTWLKKHAEHLQDKTILIAREQTQGRGRSDRSFHSARDRGLYLSVLLKETISDLPLTKLTALCALAAHRAIKDNIIGIAAIPIRPESGGASRKEAEDHRL